MTTLGTFQSSNSLEKSIVNILRSGRLTYGPVSAKYEREFARIHNCEFAIVSNSGTSALQVAIQAMKELYLWVDGSEIIIPSTTFVATANAIIHCNLVPVLVDVDPIYYCIDPQKIEDEISARTKAIVPVHLFGLPADMNPIMDIASRHNLKVIEDSCECVGVAYDGKSVGSWGDAAAFSTYAAHHINTGVGGMTTVREDKDLASTIRSLVNHGISISNLPTGHSVDVTWLERNFRFDRVGHSFRITELEAMLGMYALDNLWIDLDLRSENAQRLSSSLKDVDELILPQCRMNSDHSWMVYPLISRRRGKQEWMKELRKNGIQCRDLLPLTNQPCYSIDETKYPISKKLNEHGFYIGCHQGLTTQDIEFVSEIAYKFAERKNRVE